MQLENNLYFCKKETCMARLNEVKSHLVEGNVYRRADLIKWSKSVDRHLDKLTKEGFLQKVSVGVYYYPKTSVFGIVPPEESELIHTFLKDNRFLLVSPNMYNSLGVGTTQLYNRKVVYNHKRHGRIKLGNREFEFKMKHHFPTKITEDFLLVDMVNNLQELAEDHDEVLTKLIRKAAQMSLQDLKSTVANYGTIRTKKIFNSRLFSTVRNA